MDWHYVHERKGRNNLAKKNGRTKLYIVCVILFFVSFVAFLFGFSCPAWVVITIMNMTDTNFGLWQICEVTFGNCENFDFDDGEDWMVAVRVLEIFALLGLIITLIIIAYENLCTPFRARPYWDRMSAGVVSLLAGLSGLIGVIVYVAENGDLQSNVDYGWALALTAASSVVILLLAVGFLVSGLCLEPRARLNKHQKGTINGRAPYLTTNDENYELGGHDSRNHYVVGGPDQERNGGDNLPGYAMYFQPGMRQSYAMQSANMPPKSHPPPYVTGRGSHYVTHTEENYMQPFHTKSSQNYAYSALDHRGGYDLSEGFGYVPGNRRGRDNPVYIKENAYSRDYQPVEVYARSMVMGVREEDPYNRVHRASTRAGYNDPYGFDRLPSERGVRGSYGLNDQMRTSHYRALAERY